MKIWIASDSSLGHLYSVKQEDENLKPMQIAYKYGRGEFGEIIHIWNGDFVTDKPDAEIYWDSCHRKYRKYA